MDDILLQTAADMTKLDQINRHRQQNVFIEGSLNRNFRQYGELKSSSRVVKSVDRRCNSQKVRRKEDTSAPNVREVTKCCVFFIDSCVGSVQK